MEMVKYINRFVISGFLAMSVACGGGGGSIDKDVGSSSSASSSSVVATCANTPGAVFIDEACGAWEDPSFYEQNRSNFTGGENTTGVGNNLNLSVIAEGVETRGQQEFLADHGCYTYQGYLFSKPLPIAEFEALLVRSTLTSKSRKLSRQSA